MAARKRSSISGACDCLMRFYESRLTSEEEGVVQAVAYPMWTRRLVAQIDSCKQDN